MSSDNENALAWQINKHAHVHMHFREVKSDDKQLKSTILESTDHGNALLDKLTHIGWVHLVLLRVYGPILKKKERKDDCLGCVGAIKRAMGGSLVLENV